MCYGQITHVLNAPRSGDSYILKQVECFDPGESGRNVVWDISELTVKRKKYYRRHMQEGENPDSISAIDRSTKYYYNVLDAGIYEIGYENNQTKVSFDIPIKDVPFPITYGDSCRGLFHGTGIYCDRQRMRSFGSYSLKADAEGSLVLPSGDTLRHVMRLHLQKSISSFYYPLDSIHRTLPEFCTDSIMQYQNTDTAIILTDNYRWYALGYRYPILEYQTACMSSSPDDKISVAYYCSPESQEELPLDDANLYVRNESRHQASSETNNTNAGSGKFKYTFFQDSGNRNVCVSYTADNPVSLTAILASARGVVYKSLSREGSISGNIDFNYNGLPSGQYVIFIRTGSEVYTEKFNNQ